MARPVKKGLDYFPLDVMMDTQSDEVQSLEGMHPILGFNVYLKLLMKIYSEGYYYKWGEVQASLLARRVGCTVDQVQAVVADAVKVGLLDKALFDQGVLTSRGIQKRYAEVKKKSAKDFTNAEFWLLSGKPELTGVNPPITPLNFRETPSKAENSTQRKEKKSKEKESKEKETNLQLTKIQFSENVFLTREEHEGLKISYGEPHVQKLLDHFSLRKKAKGYTYESDDAAIRSWGWQSYNEEINRARSKLNKQAPPGNSAHVSPDEFKRQREEWLKNMEKITQ